MIQRSLVPVLTAVLVIAVNPAPAAEKAPGAAELGAKLKPFHACLSGKEATFDLQAKVSLGEGKEEGTMRLSRIDDDSFTLSVEHREYPLVLERTADRTCLALPKRGVAFIGAGPVTGEDTLRPAGITTRIVSQGSAVFSYLSVLAASSSDMAAAFLTGLVGLKSEDGNVWTLPSAKDWRIAFSPDSKSLDVSARGFRIAIRRLDGAGAQRASVPAGLKETKVDRAELERVLARGTRRGLEILAPSMALCEPPSASKVPHGEVREVEGQRLVLLKGTPSEVGEAHGKLLAEEGRRCADSTVFVVGAAQTVRTGRWFLDDLREAYRRLEPFLTADYKAEVDGIADGAKIPREEARLANVFPELFHCSGFAVFGRATAGGKLYHGRVLDYMTEIGLQDAAATFVIAIDGKIPFATVGYAGFAGSVSGMNAKGISLGEMGGGGQGKWDGVPMALLMRRALEECSTLDEVMKLWSTSPRTCQYFYVFADGKGPSAVGVAATPEKIEFVKAGEAHPLLGDGIPDAVVLSAGDRLKTLRQRVQESHGAIDAEKAMWLMTRPVAMSSNLHDALFVPQDLVLYVSHADRKAIAANRPYVRFDLGALVRELTAGAEEAKETAGSPYARATIDIGMVVSDLDRSLKFYRDDLGLVPAAPPSFDVSGDLARDAGLTDGKPLHVAVLLIGQEESATRLKLIAFPGASRSDSSTIDKALGVRYLTFIVKDMDAAIARLEARSVPAVAKGPVSLPGGVAIALVRDPDGNFVELVGRSGGGPKTSGDLRPLFNGTDLAGWRPTKNAAWKIRDGAIFGEQGENAGGGWLVTEKTFGDFELRFRFRMTRGGNSGVAFRFPAGDATPSKTGYECQLSESDPKFQTSAIFGLKNGPRGLLKEDGWNEGRIVAKGNRISTSINGKEGVTVEDGRSARGSIGLQVHGTELYKGMQVEFKDIEVREQ